MTRGVILHSFVEVCKSELRGCAKPTEKLGKIFKEHGFNKNNQELLENSLFVTEHVGCHKTNKSLVEKKKKAKNREETSLVSSRHC